MKRVSALLLIVVLLLGLAACGATAPAAEPVVEPVEATAEEPVSHSEPDVVSAATEEAGTIAILFTNDVHCAINDNIGYAGLASYKKNLESQMKHVVLVDCGDAVQGSYLGAVSKGELPVQIMNAVDYDFAVPGNHEFDYGMERLSYLMELSNAEYLCCNISYTGNGENPLASLRPYEIVDYSGTKIAYIGVTTPTTVQESTPTYFKENGEYVYDFHGGEEGQTLYDLVQNYVDECREQGADYVILLSHMGIDHIESPFSSYSLAENTTGIDVFLDGHSHTEIPCHYCKNLDGEDVLICQTGTQLSHIGRVTITPDGYITVGYVDYAERDEEVQGGIDALTAEYDEQFSEVVATSSGELSIYDENGIRIVRSRETAIGNLCADAFRIMTGADIGYVNGGGVRDSLPKGDITYQDIIDVHPFGNNVCTMELTGQEILDMLEYFFMLVEGDYVVDGEAVGENGSFASLSGIKCTVHTSIPSSVEIDEKENIVSIGKTRRVSDVQVLNAETGEYEPIQTKDTYVLASHDYMLKNGGCGMELFLADHEVILDCIAPDYQNLIAYMQSLDGDIAQYAQVEGRVIITD